MRRLHTLHTKLELLTEREKEVLALIGRGLSLSEIARRLHRSQKTVESHRFSLGRKLEVSNRVELARIAITAGLAPLGNGENSDEENHLDSLRQEVVEHQHAWDAMRAIDAGLGTRTGHHYLRSLTPRLCASLNVRAALLTEFAGRPPRRHARVLACEGEKAFEWDRAPIAGTPCEHAAREGFVRFDHRVRDFFPDVPLLQETEAKSYMGVSLRGAHEEPIGVLGLLHDGPFDDQCQPEVILRICAARAAAELERARMDEKLLQLTEHLERRVQQRTAQLEQVNHQLRQNERKFRTLVETMTDGLGVMDAHGSFTYVNQCLCDMLGYTADQMIGRSPTEFIADPDDAAWFSARDFERRQGTHQHYELHLRHADGSTFRVRVAPRSLYDDNGEYTGSFGVVARLDAP